MSDAPYPDIEIYVHGIDSAAALAWVAEVLGDADGAPHRHAASVRVRHRHQGQPLDVLVVENACDGFTSILFESPHLPWTDDLACARQAAAHFNREVRCSAGSWETAMGESDDGWLQVGTDAVRAIRWQ